MKNNILLLALGNDILGDDAVGLLAARRVQAFVKDEIDIVEAPLGGFALLDILQGYQKVLIVDSMVTGKHQPGSLSEMSFDDLPQETSCSPHYVGLQEIVGLARKLDIPFPSEIRILAIEIRDPFILREGLSDEINEMLPPLVEKAGGILGELGCRSSAPSSYTTPPQLALNL